VCWPGSRTRGRRYLLAFVLTVAVACALAGAGNFREAGDHAADQPQDVLARPGGTRFRTLIQAVGAGFPDDLIGGSLRALADAGRLDGLLTAIDGKRLRGVLAGQVKLLSAMLHQEKVIIGQVRAPDGTAEATQVRALLKDVDLGGAVVTAGAARSCRETAQYIAGKAEDGGREADRPHGRVIRRSIWVPDAGEVDLRHVTSLNAEDASTGSKGNGPRSRPRCGTSPSACSASPG
jgi:hypothetical protein